MQSLALSKTFQALILLLLFVCPGRLAAETLSLEAALTEALKNSPSLKASAEEITVAESGRKQALARILPLLQLGAGFSRTNDQVGVFGDKLRQADFNAGDFAIDSLNNPDSLNNFNLGIHLQAPIYASGRNWLNKEAAEFEKMAAEKKNDFHRRALGLSVRMAYFGLGSMAESAKYLEQGIGRLQALEKNYKLLRAPNSATTTSFLLSKSIRLGLQARLEDLRSQSLKLWRQLERLMGRTPGGQLPAVDAIVLPAEPAVGQTVPARDDLQALRLTRKSLHTGLRANKRRFGPEISFFTDYAVNTADFDNGSDAYAFGVLLTWSLFDYSRYATVGQLRARQAQLDYQLKNKELQIAQAVASSRENQQSALAQSKIVKEAMKSAEEALVFATKRYKEGSLPLKDLSAAIFSWVKSRLALAQVRLAAASAAADFDFQRGL